MFFDNRGPRVKPGPPGKAQEPGPPGKARAPSTDRRARVTQDVCLARVCLAQVCLVRSWSVCRPLGADPAPWHSITPWVEALTAPPGPH
ncbi:unnamed protein product [Lota lota]